MIFNVILNEITQGIPIYFIKTRNMFIICHFLSFCISLLTKSQVGIRGLLISPALDTWSTKWWMKLIVLDNQHQILLLKLANFFHRCCLKLFYQMRSSQLIYQLPPGIQGPHLILLDYMKVGLIMDDRGSLVAFIQLCPQIAILQQSLFPKSSIRK